MRAFNHPTIFAKVAAMFGTVLCHHGLDPAIAQCPPMPLRVVAAIGVDNSGRCRAWPRNPRIGEDVPMRAIADDVRADMIARTAGVPLEAAFRGARDRRTVVGREMPVA